MTDDDVFCVEDGCRQPATDERPIGMIGDDLVVELVCVDHTEHVE